MMDEFVPQASYELERKIPHHRFPWHNYEFGSATEDFQLEIIGLFVYSHIVMWYKM